MPNPLLNILVVEDEAIIADQIMLSLRTLGFRPWGPAMDIEEARGYIQRGPIDLALIDINLHGQHDGIVLGEELKRAGEVPHLFLTANTDAATVTAAKRTMPMGFIVKPFQRAELFSNIEVAMELWQKFQSAGRPDDEPDAQHARGASLFVQVRGATIRLHLQEIQYLRSAHVYTDIHMVHGEVHSVRCSLSRLEEQLDASRFVRTHRSFVVNLGHVEAMSSDGLTLQDGAVPVSAGYRKTVRERLQQLGL
jgi:DNA-binding LytR/AlgR family response regulator